MKSWFIYQVIISIVCVSTLLAEQNVNISGVFPHLAMVADHTPRTEAGTGALVPWADRLWVITYVAHNDGTGSGTGLYEIDGNLVMTKRPESVVGTYANRMIHSQSNQLIIGPHFIDVNGNVRTDEDLVDHRLAATMEHLTDPGNSVYFLAMEGEFFEVNVHTLETRQLFNLIEELEISEEAKPHFKSAYTAYDRVVVANNTYNEKAYLNEEKAGRLAEWDGNNWHVLDNNPYTEVWCSNSFSKPMIATGWDNASVILKVFLNNQWTTYRLPKASFTYDNTSCTEWMRIREVETERALMDCHGMFYEIPYHAFEGKIWGIRPVSTHLRVVPDFCSWRGMLVLGGNQSTPMWFGPSERNKVAGQPQAGLWFGKTDDLWQFGKPRGSGGVWREAEVKAGQSSEPFLMNGFDQKVVHFQHDTGQDVEFDIEIDFLGNGTWVNYKTVRVPPSGYGFHVFPQGFNAEWVRVIANADCKATVYFVFS